MANGLKLSFSVSIENYSGRCPLKCVAVHQRFFFRLVLDKQQSIFQVMASNHMVWEASLFLEML